MTTPAAYEERWANPPATPVTVPAGAPATAGTEWWDLAGPAATAFPRISATLDVPQVLRVVDAQNTAEIIRVLDSMAGNRWQVLRGDQGTAPITHAAGFPVLNAITAAGLDSLARGVPSGNGVLLPDASSHAGVVEWRDSAEHNVAALAVPGGEATPGSVYEALCWGYWHNNNNTNQPWSVGVYWGADRIIADASGGDHDFNRWPAVPTAQQPARWRLHVMVNVYDGRCHAHGMLTIAFTNAVDQSAAPQVHLIGTTPAAGDGTTPITTATGQLFRVWLRQAGNGGGQLLALQGSRAWKAA